MTGTGKVCNSELDEITAVATRVLADLESFVDAGVTTEWLSDDEDQSGISRSSGGVGVNLEELRLILDTSIRRHSERLKPRSDVPSTKETQGVKSVASVSERHFKSAMKIPRRDASRHHGSDMSSGLQEMREALLAKREQFARLRAENRSTIRKRESRRRGRLLDTGSQYDRGQGPINQAVVGSVGRTTFSPDVILATSSMQSGMPRISMRDSDPVRDSPSREEKGCNVSPVDFGPSEVDLFEVRAADYTADVQSRLCRGRGRASSASSRSSSSFSSRSHSSSSSYGSSASAPSLRSQDGRQTNEFDKPSQRNGQDVVDTADERHHERLVDGGWELDLSNFTL